jgi:hypothetical protein
MPGPLVHQVEDIIEDVVHLVEEFVKEFVKEVVECVGGSTYAQPITLNVSIV